MSYITDNFKYFLEPEVNTYYNGRLAISYSVQTSEDDYPEPACKATVNLPEVQLEPDEVLIKSYAENEGMYEAMLTAGHIGPEIRKVSTGYVQVSLCKCLIPLPK